MEVILRTLKNLFKGFLRETFYFFTTYYYNLNVYFRLFILHKLPGPVTTVAILICVYATVIVPTFWPFTTTQCYSVNNILKDGQYWMLLYSSFYHVSIQNHLLRNMPVLIWFARPFEKCMGPARFAVFLIAILIVESVLRLPMLMTAASVFNQPGYNAVCFCGFSGISYALFIVNLIKFPENLMKIKGLDQIYSSTRLTAVCYFLCVLVLDYVNHVVYLSNVFFVHWPGFLTGFLFVGGMQVIQWGNGRNTIGAPGLTIATGQESKAGEGQGKVGHAQATSNGNGNMDMNVNNGVSTTKPGKISNGKNNELAVWIP